MSLAKVNLITELSLFPLKRYIQRKPDNYQQAAQEYSAKLRELYQLNLRDRRQTLRSKKQAIESETFELDCGRGQLNGITIEKNSLPSAELYDQILLVRQDEPNELLARGVIIKVTDQQIKIKFHEPIFKESAEQSSEHSVGQEDHCEQKIPDASSSTAEVEVEQKDTDKTKANQDDVTNKMSTINFRIKFDLKQDDKMKMPHDDWTKSVESTLANFDKLKCNHIIQKNLLGIYDERLDMLNDRARVMSFTELVLQLNNQQRAAIEHALKHRLTLIEGPAGSGKTIVAAHIAANMGRQRLGRVLVCSPIQATVDKLTELIDRVGGFKVVKLPESTLACGQEVRTTRSSGSDVTRRSRDAYLKSETTRANRCHLDKLIDDEIYLQAYARFKDSLGTNQDKLHSHAYRMVSKCSDSRRRELESRLIAKANVVCCQIGQVASQSLLKGIEFDMLILDDVQVTSELDCVMAIMTKGITQVTLLCDTRREVRLARVLKRSRSVCHSNNTTNGNQQNSDVKPSSNRLRSKRQDTSNGHRRRQASTVSENIATPSQRLKVCRTSSPLGPSLEPGNLFERLLSVGLPSIDMRVQYRCHATLSNFFIHHFYAGRLKDDPETNDKMSSEIITRLMTDDESFSWLPNKKYLTAIYKVASCSTADDADKLLQTKLAKSKVVESKVEKVIELLVSNDYVRSDCSIGIIHNHQTQLGFSQDNRTNVKMGTIDNFIGQERDFIVLVASRNLDGQQAEEANIGTCSSISLDFRRSDTVLNWALTRARLGLFLVIEHDRGAKNSQGTWSSELYQIGDCKSWRELIKYYNANDLIVE